MSVYPSDVFIVVGREGPMAISRRSGVLKFGMRRGSICTSFLNRKSALGEIRNVKLWRKSNGLAPVDDMRVVRVRGWWL